MESGEDPTTQELRLDQLRREQAEQDNAGDAPTEDAAEQHGRRAEKASYLREQLEKRAEAEREAAQRDKDDR